MSCSACGAPEDARASHCVVCGLALVDSAANKWDRRVEAMLVEDIRPLLSEDESLLGSTRGKITGSWRSRMAISPKSLLAPYANLALTTERVVLQFIHTRTGSAISGAVLEFPLSAVCAMSQTDVDPIAYNGLVRLQIDLEGNEGLRLRAAGRLGEAAQDIVQIWKTLAKPTSYTHQTRELCDGCGSMLDDAYTFCPFCGREQLSETL